MAISTPTALVALLAIGTGLFISNNKMLFGLDAGATEHANLIQPDDDVLNYYLEKHRKQIGVDYTPYKNHCLRVMAFARYFLAQEKIPVDPRLHNIIAMALAYHDIALWTDGKLDYLEPSAIQMDKRALEEIKQSQQADSDEGTGYVPMNLHWSTFEEDSDLAKAIILQHHKVTSYRHANETKTKHFDAVVNACRRGDWADATVGIVRFGLPQSFLGAAYAAIPEAGFHNVLAGMAPKLSPDSLAGQLEVLKILKL